MYQFVFSKMNVTLPFTLHVSHPQSPLNLQSMASSPINALANTLILVMIREGDETETLREIENLADPIIIVCGYIANVVIIN